MGASDDQMRMSSKYNQLKGEGICVRCRKPRTGESVCLCLGCLSAAKARMKERRAIAAVMAGRKVRRRTQKKRMLNDTGRGKV